MTTLHLEVQSRRHRIANRSKTSNNHLQRAFPTLYAISTPRNAPPREQAAMGPTTQEELPIAHDMFKHLPEARVDGPSNSRSINDILAEARVHLHRLSPSTAHRLLTSPRLFPAAPAVLVDIRPQAQRKEEGSIPGALIVERNVLEWRFDPQSDARLPIASRFDLWVVVICSEVGFLESMKRIYCLDLKYDDAVRF